MERRIRKQLVAAGVAGAALAGVAVCRRQTALADLYATAVYPRLSGAVSWLSALVPFSLEEILAVGAELSLSVCKAYKEVPGLVEGTYDKDAVFRQLVTE